MTRAYASESRTQANKQNPRTRIEGQRSNEKQSISDRFIVTSPSHHGLTILEAAQQEAGSDSAAAALALVVSGSLAVVLDWAAVAESD
jgi:hypothetical protein